MQIIYHLNKPLFLISEDEGDLAPVIDQKHSIYGLAASNEDVFRVLQKMAADDVHCGVIRASSNMDLLKALKEYFEVITAAGGMVVSQAQVLLIFRKGKWDLPKGKLDPGETLEDCAVREIAEETGAKNLSIIAQLSPTYHTYTEGSRRILKESHWYLCTTPTTSTLTPQTEEDIAECRWVPLPEIESFKANMHKSIIDVVTEGQRLLSTSAAL